MIITRQEAISLGLARYFTGKPCKHGHIAERLTSDTHCVVCKRDKSKADRKKYKDRCLKTRRAWKEKNKVRCREVERQWEKLNRDRINALERARRAKDREKYRRKAREQYPNYYARNKDKIKLRRMLRYYEGPANPIGEQQWYTKALMLLRRTKKLIKSLEASRSQSEASPTADNSQS